MVKGEKNYMMLVFLSLIVVVFTTAGQILWKIGVEGKTIDFNSFLRLFLSPLVIVGVLFYLAAVVVWTILLSKYQFYLVYSLLSLSFVLTLIAARFILREEISFVSWIGAGIICLGIVLLGLGFK